MRVSATTKKWTGWLRAAVCLLVWNILVVGPVVADPGEREAAENSREQHHRGFEREQENIFNLRQDEQVALREFLDAKTELEIAEQGQLSRRIEYNNAKKKVEDLSSGIGGAINVTVSLLMDNVLTSAENFMHGHWVLKLDAEARVREAYRNYRSTFRRLDRIRTNIRRAQGRAQFHRDQINHYSKIIENLPVESESGFFMEPGSDAASRLNDMFGEWNNLIRENQSNLRNRTREANQEDEVIRKEQDPDEKPTGGQSMNGGMPCPPYCP